MCLKIAIRYLPNISLKFVLLLLFIRNHLLILDQIIYYKDEENSKPMELKCVLERELL